MSQGLAGVRKAAREHKEMKFTALLHHVTIDLLRDSFGSLKRRAAPGVDGMTWQEYETGLEDRLADLHSRLHRGAYRAQPSRRVYIEKADGRKRPLGIAALEDKIVQRAVVTILNHIYEEDFLGFSYGFRSGRSQHQALDALSYALVKRKVNYVLDADIQGFFDNLDKAWMIKFVEHRVTDRRILRLIQKWLKAGVMEEGKWLDTETGTPQGSVISPLLANIYLHYVFDLWGDVWRKKCARGEVIVLRYADDIVLGYADDIVLGFQWSTDADRFRQSLGERLGEFGLELHPDRQDAPISVAVTDSRGKLIMESILETKAATILEFIEGLHGSLSVTFEEGTSAAWLHDLLKPHVTHLVVCDPRKNALLKDGSKSDRIDAPHVGLPRAGSLGIAVVVANTPRRSGNLLRKLQKRTYDRSERRLLAMKM